MRSLPSGLFRTLNRAGALVVTRLLPVPARHLGCALPVTRLDAGRGGRYSHAVTAGNLTHQRLDVERRSSV
jgi:hypothetical protein